MSQQKGYVNNNWLNVRYNPNNNWLGQTGDDGENYAQFETPEYGLRAADIVLKNYGQRHGIKTIESAINRFAPPSDNNPTDNYINFVAQKTGFARDAQIDLQDPGVRESLLAAMIQFETPDAYKDYSSNLLQQARILKPGSGSPTAKVAGTTDDPDSAVKLFTQSKPKYEPSPNFLNHFAAEQESRGGGTQASFYREQDAAAAGKGPERFADEDPISIFNRGMRAGGHNLTANINYFRGIANSLVGNESGVEDAVYDATASQQAAGDILAPVENFEEFLDAPTFGGFVNQAFSATGQFVPSAAASITAALTGAGVAAVFGAAGTTAGIATYAGSAVAGPSLLAKTATNKIIRDVAKKKFANMQAQREGKKRLPYRISTDEENLLNGLYSTMKRGMVTGAIAQEYPQGAGIAFGNFAEQGMTDADQAIQSLAIGVPFAAIGVGGEAIVARSMFNIAKAKNGPLHRSFINEVFGKGGLKTGLVEGGTELGQEELSIQQKFSIDDEYTQAQAKMDRLQAAFAGFVGGFGIGSAGGAVSGTVGRIADGSSNTINKARELLQRQYENQTEQELDADEIGGTPDGVAVEPGAWILGQIDAMLDPETGKDSVWIDVDSEQEAATVAKEINSRGLENQVYGVRTSKGVFLTTNKRKSDLLTRLHNSKNLNVKSLDAFLANNLGYVHNRKPQDNIVVEVKDKKGNVVWYQSTNEGDLDAVYTQANDLFKNKSNYQISHQGLKEHLVARKALTANVVEPDFTLLERNLELEGNSEYQQLFDRYEALVQKAAKLGGVDKLSAEEQQTLKQDYLALQPNKNADNLETDDSSQTATPDGQLQTELQNVQEQDESIIDDADAIEAQAAIPGSEFGIFEPTIVDQGEGSEATPILAKGKKPWASSRGRDEEVLQRALELTPAEFQNDFNRNVAEGNYSDSLLKVYIKQSEANPGFIFRIDETEGGFNIKKIRVPMGSLNMELETQRWVRAAKKNENYNVRKKGQDQSGWTIGSDKENTNPQPIDMPTLTNFGRTYANREGLLGTTAEGGLESANVGFNVAVTELIDQGYELFYEGTLITELTSEQQKKAPVYTEKGAPEPFTMFELSQQRGEFSAEIKALEEELEATMQEIDDTFGPLGLPKGLNASVYQEAREKRQQLRETLLEKAAKQREKLRDDIKQFGRDYVATNPTFIADYDAIQQTSTVDPITGFEEAGGTDVASERIDIEFENRDKKLSYLVLPIGKKREKTGTRPIYSPVLSDRLEDATFIQDIVAIVNDTFKLGQTRKLQIFEGSETIDTGIEAANERIKQNQEYLRQNPKVLARVIPFGDTDIILVNLKEGASEAEQGRAMIALAHELGHSVFRQELSNSLNNPKLYQALLTEFNKARDDVGSIQYQDEHSGFEEWYADQIGSFLLNETRQATNGVESFFKRIANKLRAAFKGLDEIFFKRFQRNEAFTEYARGVVNSYRDGAKDPIRNGMGMEAKIYVRNMVDEVLPVAMDGVASPEAVRKLNATAKKILSSDEEVPNWVKKLLNFVKPADNVIRSLGIEKGTGKKLGQFFYAQSSSKDANGFLQTKQQKIYELINQFTKILGAETLSDIPQEGMNALYEAEDNTKSYEQLNPKAKEIRKWFETIYKDLELKKWTNTNFQKNFYTRVLSDDLANNSDLQEGLVQLLLKYNPKLAEKAARNIVTDLTRDLNKTIDISTDKVERFSIGVSKERAEYFRNIPTKELRNLKTTIEGTLGPQEISALEEPHIAVRKYLDNIVKKVEMNKRGGAKYLEELVAELPENEQQTAVDAIQAILGKVNPEMSNAFKNLNSVGLFLNIVSMLALTVFASFPDFAGSIIRSKDFRGLKNIGKELASYFQDPKEALAFAMEIGVTTSEAINTMYVNAGELDHMTDWTKKGSEKFFKYTGTEWFTRFTRVLAAGMGRRFLVDHGNKALNGDKRSIRFLKELDLTPQDVKIWQDSGQALKGKNGEKIKQALYRFVDESIVRPNAAERPIWASDPRFALVWQLKSFFYAYGKNIVGGFLRESKSRYNETGSLTDASIPLLLAASTMLPLTMLGFDLRERFKGTLAWALPGIDSTQKNYRRSLDMDWGEYSAEILDRSGVLGAFALGMPLIQGGKFGEPFWVEPLGPTFERVMDAGSGKLDVSDLFPIYGQLGGLD